MNIFGFKKDEGIAVFVILAVLIGIIALNLQVSFRKSRDSQRKSDIRAVHDALAAYQNDFGYFPSSLDGDILACLPDDEIDTYRDAESVEDVDFKKCRWGWDSLRDVFDTSYPSYLERLPADPQHTQGGRYYYVSNGSRFQIYAALESEDEDEYSQEIVDRNLPCGDRICNFGRAFSRTPLDKTIEEYENELRRDE